MLKLATALVAVSLFLSPALAKTKAPAPAPAPVAKCTSPEQALKSIPGASLLKRLDGDDGAKFVAALADKFNQPLPTGVDTVLIFKRDEETVVFALFVGGCYKGLGGLLRETVREILNEDDGSI